MAIAKQGKGTGKGSRGTSGRKPGGRKLPPAKNAAPRKRSRRK